MFRLSSAFSCAARSPAAAAREGLRAREGGLQHAVREREREGRETDARAVKPRALSKEREKK